MDISESFAQDSVEDGFRHGYHRMADFNLEYSGSDSPASKKFERSRRGKSAKKTTGASEGAQQQQLKQQEKLKAKVLPEQEVDKQQ
ncbi:MAG: hypothetical protein IPI60_20945 [Saprospiraceae bacterium]|nr:hypothetical protein [Saprospiraceae bacterium]